MFSSGVVSTSPTRDSSPDRSLPTALCSICRYISNPTDAIAPCCSVPSRLPAPRISRSRSAILKPWPSSWSPDITSSRLSAGSVRDLAAAVQLAVDHLRHELVVVRGDVRLDGLPVLGRGLDHAHVADADDGHVQRARDRRGRQREHVKARAHALEPLLLHDPEPLLL